MMSALSRAKIAFAAAAVGISSVALPQQDTYDAVYNVAFFERVTIGDVEITPIGIREESRCHDPVLCFRSDRLIVSAILHTYDGSRERMVEIPLRLDRPTPLPGGELWLTGAGTPPVRNGAIPLGKYSLDIEFVPYP